MLHNIYSISCLLGRNCYIMY